MLKPQSMLHNDRGIALLITLAIITVLVAAALEYNRRARFAVVATAAARDHLRLTQMAASGVQAGMALLIKDRSESNTDSLAEEWADPAKIDELLQAMPFGEGRLKVAITDELGRIQVNALVALPDSHKFNATQRLLWERFLRAFSDEEASGEDNEPTAIINSIKDWLDSGDDEAISGLSGAESNYYEDLEPPYACRNGPIQDLNELLMVKGITPRLFFGTDEKPGIARFLTVFGMAPRGADILTFPGRININTAELPVLAALLPPGNEDLARAIYDFRSQALEDKAPHDFSNPTWYKQIPGFGGIQLDPGLITTASDVFRIVARASVNQSQLTATVVVGREKDSQTGRWTCRVLSWQVG